jgi:NAD(P)-dependent dehydrogenase (short-subunit alcohol dehydrogenase family)
MAERGNGMAERRNGIGEGMGSGGGRMGGGAGLAGTVAVVTGASRGIGLAIARRLVAGGARVAITARHAEPLAAAVEELGGPEHACAVVGKADDPEHRRAVVETVTARFGPVSLLVNNAGINPVAGPLIEASLPAVEKVLRVNLIGALGWTQEVCRSGLVERGGAIINISSIAGLRPAPGIAVYGVSKAALIQLTEGLAQELAPTVRVNAVAPAVIRTRFSAALYEGHEQQVADGYPLRRLGVPQDVAGAVAFLASDDAAWITGQTLVVDGGILLTGGMA